MIIEDVYKTYSCYAICPQRSCAEYCPGYIECKLDNHQKEVRT
jgi:hypothetical protein